MRSVCFALLAHFRSAAIAAVAFVCAASADEKIIVAFRIGAAVVFARIEQQLIQIKINCLHKIAALPKAGKFFLHYIPYGKSKPSLISFISLETIKHQGILSQKSICVSFSAISHDRQTRPSVPE